jgi:CHASE2 domain-containing sensor protein/tRNA A-37 threonylcarbamoyl transferase component Bud32
MVRYLKVKSDKLAQNSQQAMSSSANDIQGGRQSIVPEKLSRVLSRLKRLGGAVWRRPALVASLTVTGLLFMGRQINLLEPLELSAYDRLMQLRPALPPDPRLLFVKVTEADIEAYQPYPLTDQVMNQLLQKLEQYQPAVIGLDIYRDIEQPPGHEQFRSYLQKSNRLIPMCQRRNPENRDIAPPPGVSPEIVGFNDIPVDPPNGIVRRALLFITLPPTATSRCTTPYSFSFQLARRYLEQKGIQPELVQQGQQEYLKLGKVVFKSLMPNDGGYQNGDTGGYQLLLNYRSGDSPGRSVTLSDVLSNRIDPSWVKDRIVMIGVTAASVDDAFYTPYSTRTRRIEKMPGVMIHGQIVSQLLSATLNGRSLFWFWPDWAEILWIWGWSLTGGIIVRVIRHPGRLALAEGTALGLLAGTSVLLFFGSGWIPLVAPTLGLITVSTGVIAYNAYEAEVKRRKAEEERIYIEQKAQEQEKNIAILQQLLKESTSTLAATGSDASLTEATEMPPDEATAIATADDFKDTNSDKDTEVEETDRRPTNVLDRRYKISKVLGAGGFGMTYLAQDIHRPGQPTCVVKHLKPARRDEKFLQVARRLFDTEAEILEKLGNHPQIPRLLAHFEENKQFYLVQEFVDGHPLSDELPVDKKLPQAQVVELLKSVLEILSFIHNHRVIHRDIKPSNIMRRHADNKIVLIDFGAVKQIHPQEQTDQESYTVAVGTRGYAPPEQYAGHPMFCSDIYAMGMIGIQAITGIPTHQFSLSETGDISWRHLANVGKDISEKFADILEKMVRYHFAARYQSATEVMEALEKLEV